MSVSSEILALSPSSYWKLDETSGTNADDSAGTTDGTYVFSYTLNQPPVTPGDATGKSVLFSNSLGAAIDFGDVYDFTGSTQFTALMFIKPSNYFQNFFWSNVDAAARGWLLRMETIGSPKWAMRRGDNAGFDTVTVDETEANFESGAARMVAMRYNGTNLILNINGVDVGSGASSKSVTAPTTNTGLRFGGYAAGGNYYDGYADDLAIWSGTALSESQLATIYNAGFSEKQTSFFVRSRRVSRR